MSATSYGWLILAFPLAGTLIIGFGWLRPAGCRPRCPAGSRAARSWAPSSPRSAR